MAKTEAQRFMEMIKEATKNQPTRLVGDLTTGYNIVDLELAEKIAESKRRVATMDVINPLENKLFIDPLIKSIKEDIKEEKENKTMPPKNNINYGSFFIENPFRAKKAEIKDVIFNGPATIVMWSDGDKTIVRCENEDFDKEKGLAMAICKKFLGTNKSKSNYNDVFKKYCTEGMTKQVGVYTGKPVAVSLKKYAEDNNLSLSTCRRRAVNGQIPAIKINGKWFVKVKEN